MFRNIVFSTGEYYHLYSRGTDKRTIFMDHHDYQRFKALLYVCNSTNSVDITKLVLSPDGLNLISGNLDGEVRIWDVKDLSSVGVIHAGDGHGKISDICFSDDGNRLLYHQVGAGAEAHRGVHVIDLK